ncbi:MAG: hypothetical protein Q9202_007077 [Teloschistes flavicans]
MPEDKSGSPSGKWRKQPEDKAKRAVNMKAVFSHLEMLSYRNEKHHRTEALELKDISKKLVLGTVGLQSAIEMDDDVGCEKASMKALALFFEDPAKV